MLKGGRFSRRKASDLSMTKRLNGSFFTADGVRHHEKLTYGMVSRQLGETGARNDRNGKAVVYGVLGLGAPWRNSLLAGCRFGWKAGVLEAAASSVRRPCCMACCGEIGEARGRRLPVVLPSDNRD